MNMCPDIYMYIWPWLFQVASRLEIRWMVFMLNVLFISAACVFALSNSWSVQTTTRQPENGVATSNADFASVLSPGVAISTSSLGTEMLSYVRGNPTVRMPLNVDVTSPVAFLSNTSIIPPVTDEHNETCPYEGCLASNPQTPETEEPPVDPTTPPDPQATPRRLEDRKTSSKTMPVLSSNVVEIPGQKGSSFWLVADSVELFFYLVILHHNTGLLFQNCILVDILLLVTCLTFILTTAISTANTIGYAIDFPSQVEHEKQ